MGSFASTITFKRIAKNESRIYRDDRLVGDVIKRIDPTGDGQHYWAIHLYDDPRGPQYVYDPQRLRDEARRRVLTHPLM